MEQLHTQLCWVMIVSGVATFVALLVGPTAPYGRWVRASLTLPCVISKPPCPCRSLQSSKL